MEQAKRFVVDVHSSYTVEAESPDSALSAVMPIVGDAENVTFGVRKVAEQPRAAGQPTAEPYPHLTKSTYKVDEVAEILRLSRNVVYEKVPCIRVGCRRLYPRATIIDILHYGLRQEGKPITAPSRRPCDARKPAKSVPTEKRCSDQKYNMTGDSKTLTLKGAATMLGLSYSKTKDLFESRKIYSIESYGRRIILRTAVEHFLAGGTALDYVEGLIKYAKEHRTSDQPTGQIEKWAHEMRRAWAEQSRVGKR